MKKLLLVVGLFSFIALASCNKDDNNDVNLPLAELNSPLKTKYPDATNIEWERDGLYYEADFKVNNVEHTAWFTDKYVWYMTETDIAYNNLPQKVKDGFQAGEYGKWKVDDLDQFDRSGLATVYLIEVEKGGIDKNLLYSKDGVLIKVINESEDLLSDIGDINSSLAELNSPLKTKYPDATNIEWERDGLYYEADFNKVNNVEHTAWFTDKYVWYMTETDIVYNNLPQKVKDGFQAGEYGKWKVDDLDQFDRSGLATVYLIEVEKGGVDKNLLYSKDGVLIKVINESEDLLSDIVAP